MFSTPRRRHVGWAILYVCATAFLLGVVATVVSTRQIAYEVQRTQLEGTPTGKKLLTASDRILDCTDAGDPATGRPAGQCFQDAQERQAGVVGNINEVAVFAAACAAGLPDGLSDQQRVIRVQRCLIDQLATAKDE